MFNINVNLRASDPSNLGREAFNMILFPLKYLARDEHGEIRVLNIHVLNLGIEPLLDSLPNGE